jgi:hypothetical protein
MHQPSQPIVTGRGLAHDDAPPRITVEQWRQAIASLLAKGLIVEIGTRNGEPAYQAVPPREKRH